VSILYEVAPDEAAISGLAPNGSSAGSSGVFRWRAIPGSAIYQLQIVRAVADRTEFVTGLLVPGSSPTAALSPLTASKLVGGQRYYWRVSAHDANGHLLARSDSTEFVYRP